MERNRKGHHAGFTILDTVLALFVIATMVLLAGSFLGARNANRRVVFRTQAAALADEEINALRRLGFANLANQTNGGFRNVLYNAGGWNLVSGGISGNALELPANTAITNMTMITNPPAAPSGLRSAKR